MWRKPSVLRLRAKPYLHLCERGASSSTSRPRGKPAQSARRRFRTARFTGVAGGWQGVEVRFPRMHTCQGLLCSAHRDSKQCAPDNQRRRIAFQRRSPCDPVRQQPLQPRFRAAARTDSRQDRSRRAEASLARPRIAYILPVSPEDCLPSLFPGGAAAETPMHPRCVPCKMTF
jgi:hypothetical protein